MRGPLGGGGEEKKINIRQLHLAPSTLFSLSALPHVHSRAFFWPQEQVACVAVLKSYLWTCMLFGFGVDIVGMDGRLRMKRREDERRKGDKKKRKITYHKHNPSHQHSRPSFHSMLMEPFLLIYLVVFWFGVRVVGC